MIVNVTKDTFEAEVLKSAGQVLVDFWAPWCGPCRMLAPILEDLSKEKADLKICKINVDEQPELARQFQIMSIPTLLFFKDGQQYNRTMGVQPKNALLSLIR